MIGLLLLTQGDIGAALIQAAEYTLGYRPPALQPLRANHDDTPEELADRIKQMLHRLDQGQGVLILVDIYGATHANMARRFLTKNRIEMITGVNLPMLIRALNYRTLTLAELIDKALTGGSGGIVYAVSDSSTAETNK